MSPSTGAARSCGRIWTDRSVKTGTYRWTWSGKTAAGKYVKPGTYKVTVTRPSKFGTTRFSRSVTVQVRLTLTRPYTCRP